MSWNAFAGPTGRMRAPSGLTLTTPLDLEGATHEEVEVRPQARSVARPDRPLRRPAVQPWRGHPEPAYAGPDLQPGPELVRPVHEPRAELPPPPGQPGQRGRSHPVEQAGRAAGGGG